MPVPLIFDLLFRVVPSCLLVFIFFESNLKARYNKYIQALAGSALYMTAGILGEYLRENYAIESIDFMLAIVIFMSYCILLHTDSLSFKVFIGVLLILLLAVIDSLFAAIVYPLFPSFDFRFGHMTLPALIAADIDLVLNGIVYYLVYSIIKKIRHKQSINRKALIFMIFPISQMLTLMVLIKVIMMNGEYVTTEITWLVIVCVVVSVISDIFCYRGLIQNSQLHETKMRNEQLEYERNTQYRYYEKINDLQHEMMKYRHDFKNALATAYALCDNMATVNEGKNMLDELSRKNDENKPPFFCANPIANTILWDKSKIATEKGIRFEADASLGENAGVDGVDICCLIVNMLDNAIRGAGNSDGDKKIEVKIKEENERIYISVSNSADMPDFETSDKLPSTKKQKNHGYGTEIIKSIVQKYDGEVLFGCKQKVFNCALSIRKDKDETIVM